MDLQEVIDDVVGEEDWLSSVPLSPVPLDNVVLNPDDGVLPSTTIDRRMLRGSYHFPAIQDMSDTSFVAKKLRALEQDIFKDTSSLTDRQEWRLSRKYLEQEAHTWKWLVEPRSKTRNIAQKRTTCWLISVPPEGTVREHALIYLELRACWTVAVLYEMWLTWTSVRTLSTIVRSKATLDYDGQNLVISEPNASGSGGPLVQASLVMLIMRAFNFLAVTWPGLQIPRFNGLSPMQVIKELCSTILTGEHLLLFSYESLTDIPYSFLLKGVLSTGVPE